MWDFVFMSVLKSTTPNLMHDAVYKGVGNLRASSPKRYVKKNIYFVCFLQGNQEKYQGDQLMVHQARASII
jgi:hypothetical protein